MSNKTIALPLTIFVILSLSPIVYSQNAIREKKYLHKKKSKVNEDIKTDSSTQLFQWVPALPNLQKEKIFQPELKKRQSAYLKALDDVTIAYSVKCSTSIECQELEERKANLQQQAYQAKSSLDAVRKQIIQASLVQKPIALNEVKTLLENYTDYLKGRVSRVALVNNSGKQLVIRWKTGGWLKNTESGASLVAGSERDMLIMMESLSEERIIYDSVYFIGEFSGNHSTDPLDGKTVIQAIYKKQVIEDKILRYKLGKSPISPKNILSYSDNFWIHPDFAIEYK
jgi:hypothetical protein